MVGRGQWRTIAFLAAVLVTTGLAPSAWASPTPHMTTGNWQGFLQGVDDPNIRDGFTMTISSQVGRRFDGDVCGMIIDGCTPIEGTISSSSEIAIVGRGSQVQRLTIEGSSRAFAENLAGELDPCILEGRFGIVLRDGTRHDGDVVAVHVPPDTPDAPSFAGERFGSTSNGGAVQATLSQDGGDLTGRLTLTESRGTAHAFSLVGTAFSDASGDGVLLVGSADDALIAIGAIAPDERGGAGELGGSYVMLKEVDPAPGHARIERGSITLSIESPGP
jgi:hypothetical protein